MAPSSTENDNRRLVGVQKGDRVGLLSENRYEWPVVDLAVLGLGAVLVPIYPTLTAQQVRHILSNAEAKVVVKVDAEGLSGRLIGLPVTPSNYSNLRLVGDRVYYRRVPSGAVGGGGGGEDSHAGCSASTTRWSSPHARAQLVIEHRRKNAAGRLLSL